MSSKTSKRLVPELRFPEFQESPGWEQTTLGKIATFEKGKGISKAEISATGTLPCVRYGELYTRYSETIDNIYSYTNVLPDELVLSQANDVIIPASGETKEDIATASCVLKSGVALGGDLNIIRSMLNGVFLSYYLNSERKEAIAKLAQGISVVHLYSSQLKTLRIAKPEIPEQKKIASCLSSIDELIATQAVKIEAIKAHKKGLMQRLFPTEGKRIPRLRFPKFRGGEAWEVHPFGKFISEKLRPRPKPALFYRGLGIRSHGKGTFLKKQEDPKKNQMDRLYEVMQGDLVVSITFAWEGAIAIANHADHGALVSHRFPTYIFNSAEAAPDFFRQVLLQKDFVYQLGLISPGGAGRNKVMNKRDFLKIGVLVPGIEEQRRIGDLLSALDALIAVHTQKLETLKAYKKGLLQGLFPVAVEGDT